MDTKLNVIILLIISVLMLFLIQVYISMEQKNRLDKVSVVLDEWRLYETDTNQ